MEIKIGGIFGNWEIISFGEPKEYSGHKLKTVICKCACGFVKTILVNSLKSGKSKSCGCERIKINTGKTYAKKHGISGTKIFIVWKCMRERCLYNRHKSFDRYGGRGIIICDEWLNNPINFYNWAVANGWALGLQIDRINNNGNYEPSNCRFVTPSENLKNRNPYKKKKITDTKTPY